MIVATIGIVLILIAAAGAVGWSRDRPAPSTADKLLDARLARGEISTDEHRHRRQVLTEAAPRATPSTVWWLVGGVGVLLLIAGPLSS